MLYLKQIAISAVGEEPMTWNSHCFTGSEIEEEVVGRCMLKWNGKHVPYQQSMRSVMANQPWDPSDPEPKFANDLHASVALALKLDDWSRLKLYTAVGSPLDYYHGVDCFFEFEGLIVTIDVTVNPNKLEYKADLVLNVSDLETALIVGPPAIAQLMAGGAR
ncbi:MAG: hypothetical protein NUV78_02955 [Candidatus Zambryskibacteria bacterium]|nr:hypothetical protein [Candidatus Zambryskibacteria bacterium]